MLRKCASLEVVYRAFFHQASNDAIMVEHWLMISCQPDVGLKPGTAEPKSKGEGVDRVLLGVRASPAVRKRDRYVEQRGQPLLHTLRVCSVGAFTTVLHL